jgi:cell shape-determining protein MreD
MPSVFGVIADYISISLLPGYQLALLILMFVMHELAMKKTRK